jgi:hypothetical protein
VNGRFAIAILIPAAVSAGCGYSTRSLIADDHRTVHVAILENRTFRRDVEFALTRSIQDEILSRTDLRLAGRDDADLRLEGEIVDFIERVLSADRQDRVFESSVQVTVRFRLIDQRTGAELRRFTLTDSAPFVAALGQDERTARGEAFADLAEHLVYEMEQGF